MESEYLKTRDINAAKNQIEKYVYSWINEHLKTEDKKYVNCFKEHGLK